MAKDFRDDVEKMRKNAPTYRPPADRSLPEFRVDQPLDKNFNDCKKDWRNGFGRNGGPESAEGYPGFVPTNKGKRR